MKRLTLKGAQAILRRFGISLRKRDGEYRVNYSGGKEDTAYYTDYSEGALQDAFDTGLTMITNSPTLADVERMLREQVKAGDFEAEEILKDYFEERTGVRPTQRRHGTNRHQ